MPDDRPITSWSRADDIDNITVGAEIVIAPPAPAEPSVPVTSGAEPEPTIWNIAT
jgi:hypothetical protein